MVVFRNELFSETFRASAVSPRFIPRSLSFPDYWLGLDKMQMTQTARGQMSYKCQNCNRFYMRLSCLRRHIRVECGKAPAHQCVKCQSWFKYKHNLQAHMRLHNEDPKHACHMCPKKFYRRDKLVEHEKKYHNLFVNQ